MFKKKIFKICLIIVLVALFCYVIYMVVFQKINKRKRALEMQLNMVNNEIEYLKKENNELKEGISKSTQEEYLEKEARLNFGFKKEGETAVILSNTTTTKNEDSLNKNSSLWDKIKEWWVKL